MNENRINIVQGEYAVSGDPYAVIYILLGSCVSICMFDVQRGIGGMNRFLHTGSDLNTRC